MISGGTIAYTDIAFGRLPSGCSTKWKRCGGVAQRCSAACADVVRGAGLPSA
jgi:hypothetical protein